MAKMRRGEAGSGLTRRERERGTADDAGPSAVRACLPTMGRLDGTLGWGGEWDI